MVGANQIGPDPMFVNASTAPYDFHLQPGSLAIDSGVNILGVTSDADGVARPQGRYTDLGAFEYALPATVANLSR
jgi:hypothetical protein